MPSWLSSSSSSILSLKQNSPLLKLTGHKQLHNSSPPASVHSLSNPAGAWWKANWCLLHYSQACVCGMCVVGKQTWAGAAFSMCFCFLFFFCMWSNYIVYMKYESVTLYLFIKHSPHNVQQLQNGGFCNNKQAIKKRITAAPITELTPESSEPTG